eukprot:2292165-Pyramimonas_sp.AAC.1
MAEWVARVADIARAEGFPYSERDAGALFAAAVEHLLEGADRPVKQRARSRWVEEGRGAQPAGARS